MSPLAGKLASGTCTPKEAGLHFPPTPGAWDFWLITLNFDNGWSLLASLHFGNLRAPADRNVRFIEFSLYDPDGNCSSIRRRYNPEECRASEDKLDVVLKHNFFRIEDDGKHHFYFNEKNVECDVFLERIAEGYWLETFMLSQAGEENYYYWVICLPRAKVKGTLIIDGKAMDVVGEGYHDNQWCTVPMIGGVYEEGTWAHLFVDDYTIDLLGQVETRERGYKQLTKVVIWKGSKAIIETNDASILQSDWRVEEKTGFKYPGVFSLNLNEPGIVEGEIKFDAIRVMSVFDLSGRRKPFDKWFRRVYEHEEAVLFRSRIRYHANLTVLGEQVTKKGMTWYEYHKPS